MMRKIFCLQIGIKSVSGSKEKRRKRITGERKRKGPKVRPLRGVGELASGII